MELNKIYQGHCLDVLKTFTDESVNAVVTSPPYWGLRDYGMGEQIGLESSVDEYVQALVEVFRQVKRVLRDDGTLWLNLGDAYAGSGKGRNADGKGNPGNNHMQSEGQFKGIVKLPKIMNGLKPKDLIGLPWRVAFALQQDGWYLRQDIIWNKPNAMPESVTDRPTKSDEYIFLLSKSPKYFYDHEIIKEQAIYGTQDIRGSQGAFGQPQKQRRESKVRGSFDGKYGKEAFRAIRDKRNKRSVWTVSTKPLKEAHFATFPQELIEPCVLAGCPINGVVLDPFFGSGTTGVVSLKHGRNFVGIELNPEYIKIAEKRLSEVQLELIHEM
ncbi:site-specific DNA-methyltransferase [Psychrobacillus sp. NEAU-3TGS]|uniref:DNA-methyltransferase n=1 Tax=Psychrobacillus sp. NEAU-3TGS TaxID=2995412 RepID=UPI0024992D06|nr:site-specific DNA-methyltransferase [Psychrobacillus sp. NEAU-3TGS]MDI2588073.1 site-specific DNA-methyltransferase [Psychrobacillus sp. NEAU-3TGS]